MNGIKTVLFLSCMISKLCSPQEFLFKEVSDNLIFEDVTFQISCSDVILPLSKPVPKSVGRGKDSRVFAYELSLKGLVPIFVSKRDLKNDEHYYYYYNPFNYYLSTSSLRNQIGRKSAFDCNVRLLLDEVNTSPVAYLLWNDFEDKESGTRYLKISNLSKCELRKYLDNAIIYPYIAVIIFTKDKIYVKSDGDRVFRRYLRTR